MIQVVFVCLGNICRSPLAEAIFLTKLNEEYDSGISFDINVTSAATSDWNLGDRADHRSIQTALKYQYTSIESHRARQLTKSALSPNSPTMIICMDNSNISNVQNMLRDRDNVTVHLFSDFGDEKGTEVPDPYYGELEDFEQVLLQCERYSEELMDYIKNTKGIVSNKSIP